MKKKKYEKIGLEITEDSSENVGNYLLEDFPITRREVGRLNNETIPDNLSNVDSLQSNSFISSQSRLH